MQSKVWKKGKRDGCLLVALVFSLLMSTFLFAVPVSAAEGTLPGEYPPVYPLKRPSYSINSFPLKRPPLGTTKLVMGECLGGFLKQDGTIEWFNGATATAAKINQKNIVDFAVGWEYGSGGASSRKENSAIALDKDGKVYAATISTRAEVTNAVAAINAAGSAWQKGDIVHVQCGAGHFVGLKADGTVIATGRTTENQLVGIHGATGIVKIMAQETATMLLKYDGTVSVAGKDSDTSAGLHNTTMTASWKTKTNNPIVDITLERHNMTVLRADGTVENAGSPSRYGLGSPNWKSLDIVQIASADTSVIGLKSDGSTVVHTNYHDRGISYKQSPRAFYVVNGFCGSAVLREDGTIYAITDGEFADSSFARDIANQFADEKFGPYITASPSGNVTLSAPQQVTLTSSNSYYTALYYTTDGSDPKTSNTRTAYTAPLDVNGDVTIRTVPYSTSEQAYGVETNFTYTFTYPQIVPSKQPGAFLNPFKLTATAGGCQVRYTTSNRDVQLTDPVLPAQGLTVEKTVTVRLAADFGGRLVSPLELSYTKTDVGVMAAKDSLKLQFRASSSGAWGDTPVWTQGAQVQASVTIEKIVDEQLPAVLVLLVEDTSGGSVRTIARKVSFVNVTASGQAATALLTLPEGTSGALRAKAFLMDGFARLRPVSTIVTK